MKGNRMIYSLILLIFTGCTTTSKIVQRIPFPEAEYGKLPKTTSGNSTVKGEAFFVDSWAQTKKCAGATIYLFPITSYTKQQYREAIVNGMKMSDWDPRCEVYDVILKTDSEGKFEFNGIAEGEYYLYSYYTWDQPQKNVYGNITGTKKVGGHLISTVTVKEGMIYTVMLTNK